MSASGARATSTGADRLQGPEPDMSKSKKAPHLAAVEAADASPSAPPARRAEHTIPELERYATLLRIDCVRMLAVAKSGHLDSSLSAADIVAALYYRVLRHDPERARWPGRDRFVLSKGHAAPIQYAALARHGYFPHEDLMGLRKLDAHLQGHPDMTRHSRHRGLDRLARPGTVHEPRHLAGVAARRHRRARVHAALRR